MLGQVHVARLGKLLQSGDLEPGANRSTEEELRALLLLNGLRLKGEDPKPEEEDIKRYYVRLGGTL